MSNFICRQRWVLHNSLKKNKPTNEYIGCDKLALYEHILKQMTPEMTFENIHIDHIKPISKFKLDDEKEIQRCFNYTNLQPLLIKDNLIKGCKWTEDDEIHWTNNIIDKKLL